MPLNSLGLNRTAGFTRILSVQDHKEMSLGRAPILLLCVQNALSACHLHLVTALSSPEFLSVGTIDIWDWIILSCEELSWVLSGIDSISGLYTLDACNMPPPSHFLQPKVSSDFSKHPLEGKITSG